jgi:hypothetical protein
MTRDRKGAHSVPRSRDHLAPVRSQLTQQRARERLRRATVRESMPFQGAVTVVGPPLLAASRLSSRLEFFK